MKGTGERGKRKHYNKRLVDRMRLGNCDIDFFNFRHWKVRNFDISNLFKRNQNFVVSFEKSH